MRAVALTVLCGCRSILGIEDVGVIDEPPGGSDANVPMDVNPDGPDARPLDAAVGCPVMFQTLPNSGPRGHRYLQAPAPGSWTEMRDFCSAIGSFLAYPDGSSIANAQLELTALVTLAGQGMWIGVNDLATEGAFRTSLNTTASAITTSFIQGANGANNDCASAQSDRFNIENCGNDHIGVCECVP